MTPRARILVGALTTAVFIGIGGMMVAEGNTTLGGVVVALGVLRGILLVVQSRSTPR